MKSLIISFFILLSQNLTAFVITVRDYIVFEGDTMIMLNSPLEPYFDLFPDKYPETDEYLYGATKQYFATFEFKDSVLYLTSVITRRYDQDSSLIQMNVISEIFDGRQKVEMNWLSSYLVFGTDILGHERVVGNQKNEDFFIVHIENGKLISRKKTSPKQIKRFRRKLFKEFVDTREYEYLSEKYFNMKQKRIESILGYRIFDLTSRIEKEKTAHNTK
ncbi:hypothetical protein [Halocola ammonii]